MTEDEQVQQRLDQLRTLLLHCIDHPETLNLLNGKIIDVRPYRKVVTGDAEEGYLAMVPELPGCFTAGETPAEALEMLDDAMAGWFESALERGLTIPEPADLER